MAKGSILEIYYFKSLDSTQKHLAKLIELELVESNCAVVAQIQTAGIGSRNNRWCSKEGNLFVSFALKSQYIPADLPLQSYSLHYGFCIKEVVKQYEDNIWLKWPNDIYLKNDKIGGIITQKVKNFLVIGFGLNLFSNDEFIGIDKEIDKEILVKQIAQTLQNKKSWKQVFSKYRLEFDKSKEFVTTVWNKKQSLKNATLCDDGSLELEGKRIYSLR